MNVIMIASVFVFDIGNDENTPTAKDPSASHPYKLNSLYEICETTNRVLVLQSRHCCV